MFYPDISKSLAPSSIHVARYKVGWTIFRRLLDNIVKHFQVHFADSYLWKGHRIFAIDGMQVNIDHKLKSRKYKTTHPRAHYPLALVSSLFQLKLGLPHHFEVCRHMNERLAAIRHINKLHSNDAVVYDRSYLSSKLLEAHRSKKIHAVFRVKRSSFREITKFMISNKKEEFVVIQRNDYKPVTLRLIRYKIKNKNYYLATTLLDQKRYSIKDLKALYHARWGIEEHFKVLKKTLKIEKFHSKNPRGIKQEIGISFLLYALARIASLLSIQKKPRSIKKAIKSNMTQSISNISDLLCEIKIQKNGYVRKHTLAKFLNILSLGSVHERQNRSFPRRSFQPKDKWRRWGSYSKNQKDLVPIKVAP